MVETKSDGDGHEVKLCTSCVASIKKNEDPPLSIKAGVDFGSYHRIGLHQNPRHDCPAVIAVCTDFYTHLTSV